MYRLGNTLFTIGQPDKFKNYRNKNNMASIVLKTYIIQIKNI